MKRTFLRIVSAFMAVIMIASVNLTTAFAVDTIPEGATAEGKYIYTTTAQVIADNYDFFSAEEKAVLRCLEISGESQKILVPTDEDNKDELIVINTGAKTVTVKPFTEGGTYTWEPALETIGGKTARFAKVNYGEGQVYYAELTYEGGVYTADFKEVAADKYTVDVVYEVSNYTPAPDVQAAIANMPVYLANAIINAELVGEIDFSILTQDLDGLNLLDQIYRLHPDAEDPIVYTIAGHSAELELEDQEAIAALDDLKYDRDSNDGVFSLNVILNEYKNSNNKLYYCFYKGQIIEFEFKRIYQDLKAIYGPLENLSVNMDFFVKQGWLDATTADNFKTAVSFIGGIMDSMEEIPEENWGVETSIKKNFSITAGLNQAVLKLADTVLSNKDIETQDKTLPLHNDEEYSDNLFVASTKIQQGVNQYKVTAVIKAKVVIGTNSDGSPKYSVLTSSESIAPVFEGGISVNAITAAIKAHGVINDAIDAWADLPYDIDLNNYSLEFDFDNLSSDVLDRITTCTVTFVPNDCTVTLNYGEEMTVPYGYIYTLPKHTDSAKSYDYTVNGQIEYEGTEYRVVGKTTITRDEGEHVDTVRIPTIIANSKIFDSADGKYVEEKNILYAAAVKGDSLKFRTPNNDSGLVTVDSVLTTTYAVKAMPLDSRLKSTAKWVPTSGYAVDANGNAIAGTDFEFGASGEATFECNVAFKEVKVIYSLEVANTDIALSLVNEYAALPAQLVAEAMAQKELLDPLTSETVLGNLGAINDMAGLLESLVSAAMGFKPDAVEAAARLSQKCVNKGTTPPSFWIVPYLNSYSEGGLTWLYSETDGVKNADKLAEQIMAMGAELAIIAGDGAFAGLLESQGRGEYVEKVDSLIDTLESAMDAIDPEDENQRGVLDINPYINTKSNALSALVDALEAGEGKVTELSASELALETVLSADAPGATSITVTVNAVDYKGEAIDSATPKTDSISLALGATLTEDDIEAIEELLASLDGQFSLNNKAFYTNDGAVGMPKVGDVIDGKLNVSLTWYPKVYTVKTNWSEDIELTIDRSLQIVLPASEDASYKYIYTIGNDEISVENQSITKTFKPEDLNTLFDENGVLNITRKAIDVARDTMESFIRDMNAALSAAQMPLSFVLLENEDEEFAVVLRVSASMSAGGNVMGVAEALLPYTYVGFGGEAFYDSGLVSIQSVIDMLANSDFELDNITNAIDARGNVINMQLDEYDVVVGSGALGGYLFESTFSLTKDNAGCPLYVTLGGGSAETMLGIRDALNLVKNYFYLACNEGRFDINVMAPDFVYPLYLAPMLILDKTNLANVQDMYLADCIDYSFGLLKNLIIDEQFSIETIENTLAKLGQARDLSKYASAFEKVCKAANYIIENTDFEADSVGSVYSGSLSVNISEGIAMAGLPELLVALIKEASPDSKGLSADFAITLDNMDTTYDAIVVDYSAAGYTNKEYCTTDLASDLAKLGNNAIVILLSDVDLGNETVTIPKNVFIDLNGFDIKGNINANGSVVVLDSRIGTNDAGTVDGKLTGNFKLLAGKYTCDVTDMLRAGYAVNAQGYVYNKFYTLTQSGDNIEIVLSADLLNADVPDVKALLLDAVVDLALNFYTSANFSVDEKLVYGVELIDVVGLLGEARADIINTAINIVKLDGVNYIVNDILNSFTDFAAMAEATRKGECFAEYDYETHAWLVKTYVTEGNYVGVDIVTNEEAAKQGTLGISFEKDEKLADLFEKLGEITEFEDLRFNINSIEYAANGLEAEYEGAATVTLNLAENSDYAALVAIAVAYKLPNGAQKSAIVDALGKYFEDGETIALVAALENVTVAQLISAVKGLADADCDEMLAALGLESSESIAALEAVYSDLINFVAKVLGKLDVTGPASTIKALRVEGETENAVYNFARESIRGYSLDVDLTLVLAALTEGEPDDPDDPIIPDEPKEVVIDIEMPNLKNEATSELLYGFEYNEEKNSALVDAQWSGITVEDFISTFNIDISHATTAKISVVGPNNEARDADDLVCTGDKLVIEAANSLGGETISIQVVILGDTDCNGRTDGNDASAIVDSLLYDDKKLAGATEMAANLDGNDRIDSNDASFICDKLLYEDEYESKYNN